MNTYYTGKVKWQMASWLITLLAVITGYQLLKEIIAFMLAALYRFFIQQNLAG